MYMSGIDGPIGLLPGISGIVSPAIAIDFLLRKIVGEFHLLEPKLLDLATFHKEREQFITIIFDAFLMSVMLEECQQMDPEL